MDNDLRLKRFRLKRWCEMNVHIPTRCSSKLEGKDGYVEYN